MIYQADCRRGDDHGDLKENTADPLRDETGDWAEFITQLVRQRRHSGWRVEIGNPARCDAVIEDATMSQAIGRNEGGVQLLGDLKPPDRDDLVAAIVDDQRVRLDGLGGVGSIARVDSHRKA